MTHKTTHDQLSLEQLADITGGARVTMKSGTDAALETALTTMQSSLDTLKTQNTSSASTTMMLLPMMMMMRR
ncbi:MAG: hypothetical protein KF773_08620 [Deltaproteobacteria bacterium]|nr:hypothetical protein [Deltaproteobacteria bacterium]MCW5805695.1 hypothetical protein [Deltaproteobacteria bacterium]